MQTIIGTMYDGGHGVPENDAEAVKWYRMAAEQGDTNVQYSLGLKYGKGEGVLEDYVKAHIVVVTCQSAGRKASGD